VTIPAGLDANAPQEYARNAMRVLRILLQAILFFLLLGIVMAIGSPETSVVVKLLLAALGGGLIWIAVLVRHIGHPHGPRST
jgi:membrane associated rhomboid family serine protease